MGIRTVAVTGLGAMGRGIAAAFQRAGFRVLIDDTSADAIERLLQQNDAACSMHTRPGAFRNARGEEILPLQAVQTPADYAGADLVIEAIPENLALKQSCLAAIESALRPEAILATNTSSLTLESLTSRLQTPERVCGLHFCHPVAERKLVEVVRGRCSSAATIDRAVRFIHTLGKRPIVVGDAPGFVLNRLLSLYLNESLELLLEGVDLARINSAARNFGFPSGPLRLIDQIGLHVSVAVGRSLYLAFPDRWIAAELLIAVYKTQKRSRNLESGICLADDGRSAQDSIVELHPSVRRIIAERRRGTHIADDVTIERRLWLPMLLEATRILDEQLVDTPQAVDTVLELGLGMTSAYRGIFGWGDTLGAHTLLQWLMPLRSLGKRYEPTPLLVEAARDRRSLQSALVRRDRAA